jgi:YidC/Oxa1 family membrane protein insertase
MRRFRWRPRLPPCDWCERAETVKVKTDLFVAEISKQGGDIVRLEFNHYKDSVNKTRTFALFEAKHQYVAQSGLIGEACPTTRPSFRRPQGNGNWPATPRTLELRLEAPPCQRRQGRQDLHLHRAAAI